MQYARQGYRAARIHAGDQYGTNPDGQAASTAVDQLEGSVTGHTNKKYGGSWPLDAPYYDCRYMDARLISKLRAKDTSYLHPRVPWYLAYTYILDGRCVYDQVHGAIENETKLFSAEVLQSPITVIHLRQKRLYFHKDTVSAISVDAGAWKRLLQHFHVLPSFLEVLHSNNGGSLKWTSYDTDGSKKVAYHIAYKMGDWGNDEMAFYARRDLITGRSFVLVMGTDRCLSVERIRDILSADPTTSIFHIALAVHVECLEMTESIRWMMDYETQNLESLTGIATLGPGRQEPLNVEQLQFNKSLLVTADFTKNLAWGSQRVRYNFEALLEHVTAYSSVFGDGKAGPLPTRDVQNLKEACQSKIELARHQHDQITQLQGRLQSQMDITKTLMAERDTRIQIGIAHETARDSQVMRGIAAVTMIFLPATFMATFFSMVFFHVGNEPSVRLMVDGKIWLYPVVTVPLTVVISFWYFTQSFGSWWQFVLRSMSRTRKEANDEVQ